MEKYETIAAFVLGKNYEVIYTDGQGQSQKKRGKLKSTNHDGFVVIETDGKIVLVPKERIDSMSEVE